MASLGYLALQVNSAIVLSLALVLSSFSANWSHMGIPGPLSPDRLLLVTAIGAVLVRMARSGELVRVRLQPAHWALIAAMFLVLLWSIANDTLLDSDPFFRALQIFGILPFLAFFVAPYVFRTRRDRMVLVGALVALGAYLGLTALFETVGLRELIFPRYINDPNLGTHFGRARGPFLEAVSNGMAMYACAVAGVIGVLHWRRPSARVTAAAVTLLCIAGTFFTLQRSVWLATVVATLITLLATRGLRRFVAPVLAAGVAVVLLALAVIPGLSSTVSERANDQGTVWGRQSANNAALNMIEARPLTGFGLDQFQEESGQYYELSNDYPLTRTAVHNLFLSYAVDLGLPGIALWTLAFALAIGVALRLRAPPDLEPWRLGLLAVATFFLIVSQFVPPAVYPNLLIWTWAGVVWAGHPSIARLGSEFEPR
jgi:O-antigen ligase